MNLLSLLSVALAILPQALAVDFPTTIEVDIVFPRNDTYNLAEDFPLVFAIQNAEAAFAFGFYLHWELKYFGNYTNTSGIYLDIGATPYASGETDPPPDTVNGIWYWAENLTFLTQYSPSGLHRLSWDWGATECEINEDADDDEERVEVTISKKQAGGHLYFSVVTDGSGKGVNLTGDECPQVGALITAEENIDHGEYCPVFGRTPSDVRPNPCNARMPEEIAACAMANVTGATDSRACERAIEFASQSGGGDGGNGGNGGDGEDAGVVLHVAAWLSMLVAAIAGVVVMT